MADQLWLMTRIREEEELIHFKNDNNNDNTSTEEVLVLDFVN